MSRRFQLPVWARRGERDPVVVGAIGIGLMALALVLSFNLSALPLIGGGDRYSAAFSEAGGLQPGNEVRVVGVKVGQVTGVSLEGKHVLVEFRVSEPVRLGDQTGASVRIKSMLGAKFLMLEPAGSGTLKPGSQIPMSRTKAAYDVVEAFSDLATTTEKIDIEQLAKALDTVADTFRGAEGNVRASVKGLAALSKSIASRDEKIRELLTHANQVTGVLSARSDQISKLMTDGNDLFAEIQQRQRVIHELLGATTRLAVQLTGLVEDNRQQIGPALDRLHKVLTLLKDNQKSLEGTLEALAPFARLGANVVGNGPWFDGMVQNPHMGPATVEPGGPR